MGYKLKDLDDKTLQQYVVFLDTVKVLKMLYGAGIAEKYFTENMHIFYDDVNAS